jgi:hypothetical protein
MSARTDTPSMLRCLLLLLLADVSLRTAGLRRTARWARRLAGAPRPDRAPGAAAAERTAARVAVAGAFYPRRALCLEQSIALFVLLRRAGAPAELRLGVRPLPFLAHAWVEVDGVPVNEQPDAIAQLVPFPALGA